MGGADFGSFGQIAPSVKSRPGIGTRNGKRSGEKNCNDIEDPIVEPHSTMRVVKSFIVSEVLCSTYAYYSSFKRVADVRH